MILILYFWKTQSRGPYIHILPDFTSERHVYTEEQAASLRLWNTQYVHWSGGRTESTSLALMHLPSSELLPFKPASRTPEEKERTAYPTVYNAFTSKLYARGGSDLTRNIRNIQTKELPNLFPGKNLKKPFFESVGNILHINLNTKKRNQTKRQQRKINQTKKNEEITINQ